MILIHTALLCEAQTFIEKLKLKKTNSNPKIYSNDTYLVVISGIGEENTINALKYIFTNYTIETAYNIGVAGIKDTSISIGELFCINHQIDGIKQLPLISVDTPQIFSDRVNDKVLYDMEGNHFLKYSQEHLKDKNIFIFKVISDHLNTTKLSKEFIKQLIFKVQNDNVLKILIQ